MYYKVCQPLKLSILGIQALSSIKDEIPYNSSLSACAYAYN